MTSTLALEFNLSEAKEHRDRAVLERGYGGARGGEPAGVESILVCVQPTVGVHRSKRARPNEQ
jgi:hypothetical protein